MDDDHPRGVGTSSVSRTCPAPAPLLAATARRHDALGHVGPCCLNLIERDGRDWLHDVNLRPAASVGAGVRSGLDQPRLGAAALSPAGVVDPPPLDPFSLAGAAERRALAGLRGLRRMRSCDQGSRVGDPPLAESQLSR